jgi:RecB family exonuclease
MGIRLVTPSYGAPALRALRDAVATAKAADPLAPVTVVVSSNPSGVAARRQLGRGAAGPIWGTTPGLAGVTFVTPYRLAELLGSSRLAAAGRRPVSTPVIAAAVRRVLATEPGVFADVATHPTTEQRLVAAHRELSELGADSLTALGRTSRRAADVVRIHRATGALLASGWFQEQDLAAAAVEAVLADPGTLRSFGPVVVHLPVALTASQANLLATVASTAPMTVVAGLTGHPDADRLVLRSLARLGIEPPAVPAPGSTAVTTSASTNVVSVSDADDEVRHAIRGVVAAAHQGVTLDRMAVLYATTEPYARLVREQLDAAGIPANGTAVTDVGGSLAGRTLVGLLRLPDRDLRRDDLMALVAAGPFRWNGAAVASRRWEVLSRRAGVVKGVDQWRARLAILADDLRAEADAAASDTDHDWRVARVERDQQHLAALASFVDELDAALARGRRARTWGALAAWCRELLRRTLGGEHQRQQWPEIEQRAADKLDEILDRLGGLDAVDPHVDLASFRRTLQLELEAGLGRVGRLGDGVLVGRIGLAEGLELERTWVLGMAEGTFPSRPREDSLLPDRERAAAGDALDRRMERPGEEHRQLLAALACTTGEVTLLYPRGDLRVTAERPPSRWLPAEGHVTVVPSFAAAVTTANLPATEQEYALRTLVTPSAPVHPLLVTGPPARSVALVLARASTDFTRFDGNLAGHPVTAPRDTQAIFSASRLEAWARCPFAYFARYVLGIEPVEEPELRLEIDPLVRGTLVHRILERFVAGALGDPPSPGHRWDDADLARLLTIAGEEASTVERRGLTGHALYWRNERRLIERDLARFVAEDATWRHDHCAVPDGTEVAFGIDGQPPVTVALADGRSVRVRGSIDRVDAVPGGYVVLDYKTGTAATIKAEDPHAGGTRLQLYLYAAAIRALKAAPQAEVGAYYWYVTDRGGFRRSGYQVTAAVEAEVLAAIGRIDAGIAAGVFPQHPTDSTRSGWVACEYCDPDGLGPRDARRRFERMALAGQLDDYLELAEPGAGEQLALAATTPQPADQHGTDP